MASVFGRERELADVDRAVQRGLEGQGGLLLISGEPGIGKTLLAEHAARRAAEAGARVTWGRCWEAGGAPAYWPWIQAFRGLSLDDPFNLAHSSEAPADARFRSFDRAVQLLQQSARERALMIVLDDLHAADLPSLLLLQLLAGQRHGVPLLVVGTYREVEVRQDPEAVALISKIGREAELLSLGRLTPHAIAAWLEQTGQDERAEEVYRLTEGNPLFVREILRLGSTRPARLPDGLGAVLDEHLSRVEHEARTLLEQAAILGREFSAVELAQIAAAPAADVEAALAHAEQADLIAPVSRGRWTFVHMLVRDRLVDSLTPSRRAALHYQTGEAIVASRADLVTAAHHFIEGSTAGSTERVLDVACGAAERCLLQLAFEAAAELGERAIAIVPAGTASRAVCSILVVVAEAYLRVGQLVIGKKRCLAAAEMAKALGETDLLARAALAYGSHFATARVDWTMVELLDEALSRLGSHDHPIRARVMARLASALVPPRPSDVPRVGALGRESIAMARRLGDAETLLYVLQYAAAGFGYLISAEERLSLIAETVELARRLDNRSAQLQVLGFYGACLLEQGRHSEARVVLRDYDALLEEVPQPNYRWRRFSLQASLAALEGDFETAAEAATEVFRLGQQGPVQSALVGWGFIQIALAHCSGNPARIAPVADQIFEIIGNLAPLGPYTAWVLAATGRASEAVERLDKIANDPMSFPWLIAAGDAAVILRSRELALRYYDELQKERFRNRMFWGPSGAMCVGPTARILGELALLLDRPAEALAHFDEAIVVCQRVGSKPLLALSERGRDAARRALGAGTSAPTATESAEPGQPAQAAGGAGRVRGLRRDGDVWALECEGGACLRLRDGKGMRYLERLMGAPGQEVHVLDLVGADEKPADAGVVLDAKAKDQYRARLEDLKDQLQEATRLGDPGRAARAQAEIDAIAESLASAVGLGGRDRVAASNVERARINVQRRLRDALDRIGALDPAVGRYLTAAVRTGTYCCFTPV